MWNSLIEHLEGDGTSEMMKELGAAAKRRFKKHYHPALAATYVLDPINFEEAKGPNFEGLTDLEIGDVIHMIHRLNGPYKEDHRASEKASPPFDVVASILDRKKFWINFS